MIPVQDGHHFSDIAADDDDDDDDDEVDEVDKYIHEDETQHTSDSSSWYLMSCRHDRCK